VFYPGVALVLALVLAIAACGLFEAYIYLTVALFLWIISLLLLAFSIYRIYKTLGAIEHVTINTEEPFRRLPQAVKSALIEIEEQKKPILDINLKT